MWTRTALAAVIVAAVAGCSHSAQDTPVRAADDPNLLAGCGPLDDTKIAGALNVRALKQQDAPTICDWTATTADGGTTDITYAWLRADTLSRETDIAGRYGYQVERLAVNHFGGMYWRDPKDPGSCAVTVADTGTVTWWVRDRVHAAVPDPCAAAMTVMRATLAIDGV